MIALTVKDKETAERFINENPFIRAQTSFGGIHSSAERRARWGDPVAAGFIRFSVGVEPLDALWGAINSTLDAL